MKLVLKGESLIAFNAALKMPAKDKMKKSSL